MDYSSRQCFDEISKLRFDGNLSAAIERCLDAISAYPEDNFFTKYWAICSFKKNNMWLLPQAYLEQLKTPLKET